MTGMEPRERLAAIQKRVRSAKDKVSKVEGRYDAAKQTLADVEQECRDNKIPPEKIDTFIEQVEQRFETLAGDLETKLDEAEKQLKPFTGESS